MVTTSNIGSGKKVNVGQSFASGMSALQTVEREKFVIVDETGTKKDAERLSLFKLKNSEKTYIVYTFNEVDDNEMIKLYSKIAKTHSSLPQESVLTLKVLPPSLLFSTIICFPMFSLSSAT